MHLLISTRAGPAIWAIGPAPPGGREGIVVGRNDAWVAMVGDVSDAGHPSLDGLHPRGVLSAARDLLRG